MQTASRRPTHVPGLLSQGYASTKEVYTLVPLPRRRESRNPGLEVGAFCTSWSISRDRKDAGMRKLDTVEVR